MATRGDMVIAAVPDLQRSPAELLDRVESGECVVVEREARAAGVLIAYARYQELIEAEERLENLELLLLARRREAAIARGEDDLVPLRELMEEWGVGSGDDDPSA